MRDARKTTELKKNLLKAKRYALVISQILLIRNIGPLTVRKVRFG